MTQEANERWMRQALALARRGQGRVAPNPLVGAVLVQNGRLIGQGYHRRFGQAHAEINALADARKRGYDPRGAALFVTLEPCCHHGKTPPCTQALLAAGIRHVEAAMSDPNPQVAGKGFAWLEHHGITVSTGLCEAQAQRMNLGFIKHQIFGVPQVILKWAQSLDAKLTYPAGSQERWLTNTQAREDVHRMRSMYGAIMSGIGTILADDPLLNVRLPGKRPQPLRAVLDSHLRVPLDCQIVRTARQAPTLIFCADSTINKCRGHAEQLRQCGCEIVPVKPGRTSLDLCNVLKELGKRNITDVLVEGGPTLLSSFLEQHLGDQALIYVAPKLLGLQGRGIESNFCLDPLLEPAIRRFGDNLAVQGYLKPLKAYEAQR